MRKVLKKGKRGNKKERLATYEEVLNQGNTSSRIELVQMLVGFGVGYSWGTCMLKYGGDS